MACALVVAGTAQAQGGDSDLPDELDASYFIDGGAIPFIWAPVILTIALDRYAEPRSTPLWFDAGEGGLPSHREDEIPGWMVNVGAAGLGLYMVLDTNDARFYHLKGFAQSMSTSSAIVTAGKFTFGRHRPDHDPLAEDPAARRSFPSGHSQTTVAALTYFALYMRYHGFNRWRPPGTLPWWESLSYTGMAALAVYVPYTRVLHNRHHVTDVLAGSLIGGASSLVFFYWQEGRFGKEVQLVPNLESTGATLIIRF